MRKYIDKIIVTNPFLAGEITGLLEKQGNYEIDYKEIIESDPRRDHYIQGVELTIYEKHETI